MSLQSLCRRHLLRHYRETWVSGAAGGRQATITELGTKKGTVNSDTDLEISDFAQRNAQVSASIYFSYDPQVRTNDFLQILAVYHKGGYRPVTNGDVYRVESTLDFQTQNRLWRVRATKRESLEDG